MSLLHSLETKGFWIDSFEDNEITEGTYADFLYSRAELTTSPKGVCPIWHLQEQTILIDEDGEEWIKGEDECLMEGIEVEEEKQKWVLCYWTPKGQSRITNGYYDENEATEALYECYENENEKQDQMPDRFYTSKEELNKIEFQDI